MGGGATATDLSVAATANGLAAGAEILSPSDGERAFVRGSANRGIKLRKPHRTEVDHVEKTKPVFKTKLTDEYGIELPFVNAHGFRSNVAAPLL